MAHWIIFGATKGVGHFLAKIGTQQGHQVSALVRSADDAKRLTQMGIECFLGDATDFDSLQPIFGQANADTVVFTTVGGNHVDFAANYNIIRQAEQHHIQRLLFVTSMGCGDTWHSLSERAKALFGHAVRLKSMAESYLQTSNINFTIIRPGGLMNSEATHNGQLVEGEAHGVITREDVAITAAKLVDDPSSYKRIYSLIDPTLKPNWGK